MSRLRTEAAQELAELAPLLADGPRLSRGRAYQRKGQVTDLEVTSGTVTALVHGSRDEPYEVTLACREAGDNERSAIGADLTAAVPGPIDVAFSCGCPDWGDPCKHGVAAVLAFAQEVDDDPALLLLWRGIDDLVPPAPAGTGSLVGHGSEHQAHVDAADDAGATVDVGEAGRHEPADPPARTRGTSSRRSTWGQGDNRPAAASGVGAEDDDDDDGDDALDPDSDLGRFFVGAMPREATTLIGPLEAAPLGAYDRAHLVVENLDVAPVLAAALDAIADHWLSR